MENVNGVNIESLHNEDRALYELTAVTLLKLNLEMLPSGGGLLHQNPSQCIVYKELSDVVQRR